MDINISAATDLAASSWAPPKSSGAGVIPENETFHHALQSAADQTDSPEKIAGVSKQFEALMVGQILKSARESSGGGWLSNEDDQDDQSGSLVMELGEQGLSQAIAAHGGLGIAKMVTANLQRGHSKTASSDSQRKSPLASSKHTETNTGLKRD